MSEEAGRGISEVTRESGAFGKSSFVVTVDGDPNKFKSEEEAVAFRKELLDQQEQQQLIQKQQAAVAKLRAEFDADPECFAVVINPPLAVAPRPGTWLKAQITESKVDAVAYTEELNDYCFELSRKGYEIVSLTPLTSGYGGYTFQKKGGAGWGVCWTEGVLLLARKVRKDS